MADIEVPQLESPQVADNLARFGQANGANRAATINYDVPLPGSYSFQRIIPLELPGDRFVQAAASAGTSLTTTGVVDAGDDGIIRRVDSGRLADIFTRLVNTDDRPIRRVSPMVEAPEQITRDPEASLEIQGPSSARAAMFRRLASDQGLLVSEAGPSGLKHIMVPAAGLGRSIQQVEWSPQSAGTPRLALVETWEVRSSLGDYGLGRTLQTFSLLPGERTTIAIETWRTDASTREEASSVFDSSDEAAQSRFTSALNRQTGSAFQDQGGWAVSVGTKASAGFNLGIVSAQASVEAGFSANHQEASQRFATDVATSSQEHASQVNNSRRQSVQATSSTTTATGSSSSTVREIANTNLRRVLNFVFRELNQTYETLTVLRDVRIAFYNGNLGSAEIVPLAELRKLLGTHIVAARREEIARIVLAMCAERLDSTGTPVPTLQVGHRPNGNIYEWSDATLGADGSLNVDGGNALDAAVSWRFAPGKLGEGNDRAAGVIVAKDTIVLRTDNVVAEALLGKADALDPYASALQALDLYSREADIEWKRAETRRVTEALELVESAAAGEQVAAFEKLLGDKPEIEVVPVAAVRNGGPN